MGKLIFLMKVIRNNSDSWSGCVVLALCDDIKPLCLVRECRELEEWFGLNLPNDILRRSACLAKEMNQPVYEQDKIKSAGRCLEKTPLIAKVAEHADWAWLLDAALDLHWKAVKGLLMLNRMMSHYE